MFDSLECGVVRRVEYRLRPSITKLREESSESALELKSEDTRKLVKLELNVGLYHKP